MSEPRNARQTSRIPQGNGRVFPSNLAMKPKDTAKSAKNPPDFSDLRGKYSQDKNFTQLLLRKQLGDDKGRYLHWDKLRHLEPPDGLHTEQWWLSLKLARSGSDQSLPLRDKSGLAFRFVITDQIQRDLHWLDRHAAGSIHSESPAIQNPSTRDTYLIRSLTEEAINSSQLEGASTTRDVAKELLRENRPARNKDERMILNNYDTLQFIREIGNENLTPSMVQEIQRRLTDGALNDDSEAGRYRMANEDINVIDMRSQAILHAPPSADELPSRMQSLCDFANAVNQEQQAFVHPVIRAITLHFMLAYDHPFVDGNGRTARALFYWAMTRQGYWLTEFISLSRVIKKAPAKYAQAYLYTESDEQDTTYFLLHQLACIKEAIKDLHEYLDAKTQSLAAAQQRLMHNPKLSAQLNFRQLALIKHALEHPGHSYTIEPHQRAHGISYDIARKDLLQMADELELLIKTKRGRQYIFVSPNNLDRRISN